MIVIGCDHGGFAVANAIKKDLDAKNIEYKDFCVTSEDSVDYAPIAYNAANLVANGECDKGILVCGTGIGMSLAANKIKGIRAAACSDKYSCEYTRLHNDANILCLGGRVVSEELAVELVDIFLSTEFEGGRHQRRIDQIASIENGEDITSCEPACEVIEKRVEISKIYKDCSAYGGKTITVSGWARTIRDSKALGFIELNDGSCFKGIQIVFESEKVDNYKEIASQNVGAALSVTGKLLITPGAKQPFEINADSIVVEGKSAPEYPLQKKRHSLEYLRTIAHLRGRTNTFSAAFRVRSAAAFAIHRFFNERGFVYAHTPLITGSDCEGAGEMFTVTTLDLDNLPRTEDGKVDYSQDFFCKHTSLTVSGQLEGECMAMAFGKIYTFGPTFRAEQSYTARHAAEFWMIEPEIAFSDLNDDMELARDMIKYVISYVLETCPQDIDFFNTFVDKGLKERLLSIVNSDFGKVTYTEAIEILKKNNDKFDYKVEWGSDLQTEHERYLTEEIFGKPVFVIDYPKEIKAFYMRLNDDGKTVAAMDLLVPGIGEIIGGSQREERLDVLLERLNELGLNEEDYWWYLDLRRYGGNKHAGFGLGFERLIMYLTGVSNIRDVLPFPRTTGVAEF